MHWRGTLAFDLFECHFSGFAPGLTFPGGEQLRVRFFQVAFDGNVQAPGGGVNPFGLAFDFAKVADGRFIDHNVAVGVGPFTAEFLITEAGTETDRFNDPAHGIAIFHLCLNFPAGLVPTGLPDAAVFISQRPALAILAQPKQGFTSAKFAAGLVIEGVHLMGARGNQPESRVLEGGSEGVNVVDSELDLDFVVSSHAAQYKEKEDQEKGPPISQNGPSHPESELFLLFCKKSNF